MKRISLALVLILGTAANGHGCSGDPNAIGVQDYGAVTGRVLDATNNRPLGNVLVSVGSLYTVYSDPHGAFTLAQVPIGSQDVSASAPGYDRVTVRAHVRKGRTADVGYVRLTPFGATSTAAPPPTPTPSPEPEEAVTEAPSGSATAAASAAPTASP